MPNRREFLQTGAAVAAVVASGVIVRGAEAVGTSPPIGLGAALYDDRYVEGRRFAAALAAQGVPTHALADGDITRFYDELRLLWQRERVAIAGFTQFGPMLVVERLGAERGMHVARRSEQSAVRDARPAHSAPFVHYYTPVAEQQGFAPALDGPLYSWIVAPRAQRG